MKTYKISDDQKKALDLIDKMKVEYYLDSTDNLYYQDSHTINLTDDLGFELSCIYKLEPRKLNPIYQYLATDMLLHRTYYMDKMFNREKIGLTINDDRYLIELKPCDRQGVKSIRIILLEHNRVKLNHTDFQYEPKNRMIIE